MFATIWREVFFNPLLNLMILFYNLMGNNLGLAILGIAVIGRLIMIPLVKKQTDMTKKMGSLKPELEKLQKKYENNQEKLAAEQMKLYKRVGYNPLGCLGTFIPQLIILYALIGVIRTVTAGNLEGLYGWVIQYTGITLDTTINTKFLFWDLTLSYNSVSSEFGKFSSEALPYIILPILVGVTQYFSSTFTQKMQEVNAPKKKKETKKKKGQEPSLEGMQSSMQKSTMLMLPLMTVFFTLSFPAAMGWYWMLQSLLLIVQYVTLDFNKTKKGIQNLFTEYLKKKK